MVEDLIKRLNRYVESLAPPMSKRYIGEAIDMIEQQAARLTALESERDALLAAAGKEAVAGWKLVPVELTPEMVKAGSNSGGLGMQFHEWMGRITVAWRHMLDAAPAAAPEKGDGRDAWQPIETAPKDKEIWGFNGEQGRMLWSGGNQWALWVWADELLSDVDPEPNQPTHWQPLPAPPAALSQKAGEQQ